MEMALDKDYVSVGDITIDRYVKGCANNTFGRKE